MSMLRSLRTLRTIPRIKDIALILGKHGFHQAAEVLQAPVRARLRWLIKREPRLTVQQPERLRRALEDLGPTFVKFGQLLSTRPDILPAEYIEELGKLQDSVAPESFESVAESLAEQFGPDWRSQFASIDPEPLASASIAQVHRATLEDGAEVVLKVRRRGIERVVRQDLWVLRLLAEFLAGWADFKLFDPEGIVRWFERSLKQELDFENERYNLLRMRRNFGIDDRESSDGEGREGEPVVYVPRVVSHLCRQGVLTTEMLRGRKISSITAGSGEALRADRDVAMAIVLSFLDQIFVHGFYHGDPHPGNFMILEGGRVALLDFGSVGKCTQQMIDDLLRLIVALARRDFGAVARWTLRQGRPTRKVNAKELASELLDVLDPLYGVALEDVRMGPLFQSLFEIALRHGIAVAPEYARVARVLVTLEGVVRMCSPDLEVMGAIRPHVVALMRRRWSAERIFREGRAEAGEWLGALRAYPRQLAEILERAAEGRLEFQAGVPELSRVGKRVELLASRVSLSVVAAGLYVGSAFLLASDVGQSGWGSVLSIGGLALGVLLAVRLALRL